MSNLRSKLISSSKHSHKSSKQAHKDMELAIIELAKQSDPILLFKGCYSKIVARGNNQKLKFGYKQEKPHHY